jgi:Ser-tRNA(Ala) deacylase AlaX
LNVNFVAFVNDKVHHYIKEDLKDDFKEQEVALKIDQERRLLNAKSHTSGLVLEKYINFF